MFILLLASDMLPFSSDVYRIGNDDDDKNCSDSCDDRQNVDNMSLATDSKILTQKCIRKFGNILDRRLGCLV